MTPKQLTEDGPHGLVHDTLVAVLVFHRGGVLGPRVLFKLNNLLFARLQFSKADQNKKYNTNMRDTNHKQTIFVVVLHNVKPTELTAEM